MTIAEPDISKLVCLACFTGPGTEPRMVRQQDGTTKIETVARPAMQLVMDKVPLAKCRRCGCSFEVEALRRWNQVDLKLLMKGTDKKPAPITERKRLW